VLNAASSALLDGKARRLARLLADGLTAPDTAAIVRLHAAVLADLEAPHLIVMRQLTQDGPSPEFGKQGWLRSDLNPAVPELGVTLDAVLATLERHGLVGDMTEGMVFSGAFGGTRFKLTALGRTTLSDLQQAATKVQPDQ